MGIGMPTFFQGKREKGLTMTVDEIVAEMRYVAENRAWRRHTRLSNQERISELADRIEEAHKRELEGVKTATEVAVEKSVSEVSNPHIQSCSVGHIVKMREAIENSNGLLEELALDGEWSESATEQIAENKAALAEPLRNCDNQYQNAYDVLRYFTNETGRQIFDTVDVIDWLLAKAKGVYNE